MGRSTPHGEDILTVSGKRQGVPRLEFLRVLPALLPPPGEEGWLSSGVLAGGVGILIMAATKSRLSQFRSRLSWGLALRLERLWGAGLLRSPASMSSSCMLPRLTEAVELARRMARRLALRGQQEDSRLPCPIGWEDTEVLRLVRPPGETAPRASLKVTSSVNS